MKRLLTLFLLLPTLLVAAPQENRHDHYLTICAVFQNEAQWLKEWIEYHLVVGVDHFVLYDHHSTDEYLAVLQPYVDQGIVDLQPATEWGRAPARRNAYRDGYERYLGKTTWLAFIDTDEFICPLRHDSLKDFLPKFEGKGGLVVNWRCFGTSGVQRLAPGELLIEKLTWASPRKGFLSHVYKSIVQPEYLQDGTTTGHRFRYKAGYKAVNTDGLRPTLTSSRETKAVCDDKLVINHYRLRTEDWAYGEKVQRKMRATRNSRARQIEEIEEENRQTNVEQEFRIRRFVPEVKKRMQRAAR